MKALKTQLNRTCFLFKFSQLSAVFLTFLAVYLLLALQTFQACTEFYESIQADSSKYNPLVVLVANKADIVEGRVVTKKQGKALAKQWNIPYFEVSAKTGDGVTELAQYMTDQLVSKFESAQTEMPERTKSGLLKDAPFRVDSRPSSTSSVSTEGGSSCAC